MAVKIDQKAYLQKYLSGPSEKKKKKKKISKGNGFKIIDDDIDLSKLRPLDGDELDIMGEGEDAPQIAGIIDERPEEVRKLEQFKTTSKWRVINEDDGFNSKLQIQEIKKDIKEVEKENELIFGKMYSDSEDEEQKTLPPTKTQANEKHVKPGPSKKPQTHSDSDFSPPRRTKERKEVTSSSKNYDSDLSPPRKKEDSKLKRQVDSDLTPPRKHEKRKVSSKTQEKSDDPDSDLSPPRKHEKRIVDSKFKEKNHDSDLSPPRMNTKSKERERARKPSRWGDFKEEERRYKRSLKSVRSENSPPLYQRSSRSPESKNIKDKRKKAADSKAYDSDLSPPRKTSKSNRNYDSDLSPPRKSTKLPSPDRRKKSENKNRYDNRGDKYTNKYSDNNKRQIRNEQNSNRRRDSSEESPVRIDKNPANNKRKYNRNSNSPPPSNKKMEKTLDGKQAGLQDAVQLRQENEAFRRREEEAFSKMTDDISGRNARVVSRKGKRETSEDRTKQKEKAERQKELDEKYKRWGKGLKQLEDQERRVQDFMHESAKPLARHKGDRDLEDRLKDVEREGDPMLKYIREKKRDRGELGPEKPSYKGSYPPNRFGIPPGYRWDGVDRSNGYEKKFFDQQSKRKAQAEEAYKWSTEDL